MVRRVILDHEALAKLKANPFSEWPSRLDLNNRIEPICRPGLRPSFRIAPGEKIFTIGSCFARHIENALFERGFDVVNRSIKETRFVLNNYSVPSMLNEIDWALNVENPFDETLNFIEVTPGRFIDLQLTPAIRPAPLDVVRKRRGNIGDVTRRITECSVVIMTLGLSEVWFDRAQDRYINHTPFKSVIAKNPSRFELHVLDYETTIQALRETIRLLGKHCRPEQHIILTVSPVPLLTTFTDDDVLVANCYSKSLLRVTAEAVASENANVDYYPSYESVTLSERQIAWQEDQHHVSRKLVNENVERMIEAYTVGELEDASSIYDALQQAHEYFEARNPWAAVRCLDPVAHLIGHAGDRLFYAELCARVGRHEDAMSIMRDLPAEIGGWQRKIWEGRILLALGELESALEAVRPLTRAGPRRIAYRLLVEILSARQEFEEAIQKIHEWTHIDRSSEPLRALADIFRVQGKNDAAKDAYTTSMDRAPPQGLILDYAEFLIEQKALDEAKCILELIGPENKANADRLRILSLLVA